MVMAARYLGITEFAHFSLACLAVLFVLSFHRTWVTQPMNVLGTLHPASLAGRVISLWRAHLLLIPAGVALMSIVSLFAFHEQSLLVATAFYLALYFLQEMQRRFAYTIFFVRQATMMSVAMGIIQMSGLCALVYAEDRSGWLWMAVLALSQAAGLAVGLLLIKIPKAVSTQVNSGALQVLRDQFVHSRWIIISQFVFWASSQMYPFLVAGVGADQAATFNAGMAVLNAANVVRMTLANYLPAYVGRVMAKQGEVELCAFTIRAIKTVAVAGLFLWPVIYLISEPLLNILYSGKFRGADQVLTWVALGMWGSMFSVVLNATALALGTTRNIFISNASGALFSSTIGVFLTIVFGLHGAILSNVVGYSIPALLQGFHMWPRLKHGLALKADLWG
jgi:O-antigen/teichoic acid export membrane protein